MRIEKRIKNLKNSIKQSVNAIDAMAYELYGLSDDEIKIVDGN